MLLGGGNFVVMPQWRRSTRPGDIVDTTLQVCCTARRWCAILSSPASVQQPPSCAQLVGAVVSGLLPRAQPPLPPIPSARQVFFTAAAGDGGTCNGTAVICSAWGLRDNKPPPACTPFNSTGVTRPALTCI